DNSSGSGNNINDIPAGNGDGNDDDSGWDDPEDIEAEIKLNQRLKEFKDSSNDSENKIFNPYTYQIAEKIKDLKEQLEKQYNQLTVVEYNHKRAIFEYLTLLNSNNRRKR
ncbi:19552_t:CDS:2, partial [Funneliformis geosporum]